MQNNTTQNNPLADALSAYARALNYHGLAVQRVRNHPDHPVFKTYLRESASNARWWKAYIVKWGKL